MSDYILFIVSYCPSCNQVEKLIATNRLRCKIVNVDEEQEKLPFPIMIYPALIKGDKLMAYGNDIGSYLEKTIAR